MQQGKKNPSVLIVQKALAKAVRLGYSSGPGTFGNHTKAAQGGDTLDKAILESVHTQARSFSLESLPSTCVQRAGGPRI